MSALKKLQNAQTKADVADILGFKTKALAYVLYIQPDSSKYKEFDIPKKSGGLRRIAAPQGGLKELQKRLLGRDKQLCRQQSDKIVWSNVSWLQAWIVYSYQCEEA